MDTVSVIGISGGTSVLMSVLGYIIYRVCNHCHFKSVCCGSKTVIDFDTQTPTPNENDKLKKLVVNE